MRRCLNGDQDAYEHLVVRYQDRALRVAAGLLGDQHLAEDAVQDAFVRCFRRLSKLEPDVAFSTWLYQSVLWAAQTHARSRRRWTGLLDRLRRIVVSDRSYERSDTNVTLLAGVRALPKSLQQVIILRYYLDLPEADIARVLNCPIGTVKSRTSAALQRLRQLDGLSGLNTDSAAGGFSDVRP